MSLQFSKYPIEALAYTRIDRAVAFKFCLKNAYFNFYRLFRLGVFELLSVY